MKFEGLKNKIEGIVRKNKQIVLGVFIGFMLGIVLITSIQQGGFLYNIIFQGDQRTEREIRSIVQIEDESPLSILTISDESILKEISEEIFENAENGDKLIIFGNKGIIYRESTNKIINIVTIKL